MTDKETIIILEYIAKLRQQIKEMESIIKRQRNLLNENKINRRHKSK